MFLVSLSVGHYFVRLQSGSLQDLGLKIPSLYISGLQNAISKSNDPHTVYSVL